MANHSNMLARFPDAFSFLKFFTSSKFLFYQLNRYILQITLVIFSRLILYVYLFLLHCFCFFLKLRGINLKILVEIEVNYLK